MPASTSPVPRSSPIGGPIWLLPSSPFEAVAAKGSGEGNTVVRPLFRASSSGTPLAPSLPAAA